MILLDFQLYNFRINKKRAIFRGLFSPLKTQCTMKPFLRNSFQFIPAFLISFGLYAQECGDCEAVLPQVSIGQNVVFLNGNTARISGSLISDGGDAITQMGLVWSEQPGADLSDNLQVIGNSGLMRVTIGNLSSGQTYYASLFATNSVGTAYSDEIMFTVDSFITDLEGYAYSYKDFCGAKWITVNYSSKFYANGDTIPNAEDNSTWSSLTTGAWCHHSNDPENQKTYGLLYNFHAVSDPRGLAPAGWHVPTEAEWNALADCYTSVDTLAGGFLKSNEMFWRQPNVGATDTTAFKGRPGGMRLSWGGFFRLGTNGHFWSTTVPFPGLVRYFALDYDNAALGPSASGLNDGFSVRFVKD